MSETLRDLMEAWRLRNDRLTRVCAGIVPRLGYALWITEEQPYDGIYHKLIIYNARRVTAATTMVTPEEIDLNTDDGLYDLLFARIEVELLCEKAAN